MTPAPPASLDAVAAQTDISGAGRGKCDQPLFYAAMRKAGDILLEPVSDKWAFDVMEAF